MYLGRLRRLVAGVARSGSMATWDPLARVARSDAVKLARGSQVHGSARVACSWLSCRLRSRMPPLVSVYGVRRWCLCLPGLP